VASVEHIGLLLVQLDSIEIILFVDHFNETNMVIDRVFIAYLLKGPSSDVIFQVVLAAATWVDDTIDGIIVLG
jgi:hypothetical protein